MAFWSAGKTVEITQTETFSRAGPSIGSTWTMKQGVDGTDIVIRSSNFVTQPAGSLLAPWAVYENGIPDTSLRWRASADVRIRDASNAANPGQYSTLSIHAFNTATSAERLIYGVRLLGTTVNQFRLIRYAGDGSVGEIEVVNVAFSPVSDTYYRIGIEAYDGVLRGYLSAAITPGDGDSTLIERSSMTYNPNVVGSNEIICVGILITIAEGAGSPPLNYSSFDNINLERLQNELYSPGKPPSGAFFEIGDTPYARYKSTLQLHELLNQAKLR